MSQFNESVLQSAGFARWRVNQPNQMLHQADEDVRRS